MVHKMPTMHCFNSIGRSVRGWSQKRVHTFVITSKQPGGGYDAWKRFKFNRMPSEAALGRVSDTAVSWGPCLREEQYDIAQRLYVGDLIYCDAIEMQQRTCIVSLSSIC